MHVVGRGVVGVSAGHRLPAQHAGISVEEQERDVVEVEVRADLLDRRPWTAAASSVEAIFRATPLTAES